MIYPPHHLHMGITKESRTSDPLCARARARYRRCTRAENARQRGNGAGALARAQHTLRSGAPPGNPKGRFPKPTHRSPREGRGSAGVCLADEVMAPGETAASRSRNDAGRPPSARRRAAAHRRGVARAGVRHDAARERAGGRGERAIGGRVRLRAECRAPWRSARGPREGRPGEERSAAVRTQRGGE